MARPWRVEYEGALYHVLFGVNKQWHIFCCLVYLKHARQKPKPLLVVDDELITQIGNFRYDNPAPPRAEVIRRFIKKALKKYEEKAKGMTFDH